MSKHIVSGAVALLMVVVPMSASALTQPSPFTIPQIPANPTLQQLLALVVDLQAILNQLLTTQPPTVSPIPPLNCPIFNAPLCAPGTHLVGGGYLPNGCQAGPRCVPDTPADATSFYASTHSGSAPLTVTFYANPAPGHTLTVIDYGDGSSGQIDHNGAGACPPPGATPCAPFMFQHTYTQPGNYTVKLGRAPLPYEGNCNGGSVCFVVGTLNVSVGPSACQVVNIYTEAVPGYAYVNMFMTVKGLPTGSGNVAITGADSYNNVTFSSQGFDNAGNFRLQASQTFNSVAANYIIQRKAAITPVSYGGVPITCRPIGVTNSVGALNVSTDPSSPSFTMYPGGATNVVLGTYKLRATGENEILQALGLKLTGGSPHDLVSLSVWNGPTQIGTAVFTGSTIYATSSLNSGVTLLKDMDTVLTIRGNLANIGQAQPGVPGDIIKVDFANALAFGQSSGSTIFGTGSTNVAGVRIMRTYPIVALAALPTTGVADGKLIRFTMTATPNGNVGIAKLSVRVAASAVTVSSVILNPFTDANYSSFAPIPGAPTGIGSTGYNEPGGVVRYEFNIPVGLQIPAGATYYFEVRGAVSAQGSASSVSTTLLGDSQLQVLSPHNPGNPNNFVWSPNSQMTSSFGTSDWTNGNGVPGLPASGLVQTRSDAGQTPGPVTVTGSATKSQYVNGVDPLVFSYHVNNAPPNSAIQIDLLASKMTGGRYPLVSPYPLDGTTRSLNLSTSQTSFPSHGTITFNISTSDQNLPIEGPIRIKITNAQSGAQIATTDIPVTVVAATTPPPLAPSCTISFSPNPIVKGSVPPDPANNALLNIVWTAQNAASRSYTIYSGSGAVFSGPSVISVSGSLNDTSYYNMPAGTYRRVDNVTNIWGASATCETKLTVQDIPRVACPIYNIPACPGGQTQVMDPVTYDSNNCEVPHWRCVAPPTTSPTPPADSCVFTPISSKLGDKYVSIIPLGGPVTMTLGGGQSACSTWCAFRGAISYANYTCTYNGAAISMSNGTSNISNIAFEESPVAGTVAGASIELPTIPENATIQQLRDFLQQLQGILQQLLSSVVPTPPLNCPIYNAPLCKSDEQLVGGGMLANGCQAGPRCVPIPPLNCPIYNAPLCGANERLVGGDVLANGCQAGPRCVPNTTPVNGSFSASSYFGYAPFAVTFYANPRIGQTLASIDYGDGTTATIDQGAAGACPANTSNCAQFTFMHTYTSAGMYTVKLKRLPGPTEGQCYMSDNCWVVDTLYISVIGGSTPEPMSFIASPSAGRAPLFVIFTTAFRSGIIDFGDGTTGSVSPNCTYFPGGGGTCETGSYLATHTYPNVGTYTAKLTGTPCGSGQSCAQVIQTLATQTITVSTVTPVIGCPQYNRPGCPAGQTLITDPVTYDVNQCEIPHWRCVATPTPVPTPGSGSCTYRSASDPAVQSGIPASGNAVSTVGGQSACRSWCATQNASWIVNYTCTYNGSVISMTGQSAGTVAGVSVTLDQEMISPEHRAQLASVLKAIEGTIRTIVAEYGW